jgi:UDP-N-acetylglucosamine--N-acetylmuramyl-(pentapeptide) pyrophosphoryl-undecaprenol N-acetylglucosamine transferase
VGGSQGATAINKGFAETLAYLNARGRNPAVIHQTGETDYKRVVKDYRDRGLRAELLPFIQNMTSAYNRADLVISRAGATTLFEMAALGKPSILIPYPYAANQHQEINASSLVRAGGAEMIHQSDLNAKTLAQVLIKYMDDPSALKKMSTCAKIMARPNAAKVIVDHLLEMIDQ